MIKVARNEIFATLDNHKMKAKRKRHSAEFKARVALEAIKGEKTAQQIAKQFDVHPVQVSEWKSKLKARLADVFDTTKSKQKTEEQVDKERDQLHSKIGELTVEIDFLRKKSKQLGL
jgi:transposase-like protein